MAKRGWSELVPQVLIPTEKVYSIRNGKKVVKDRNFFPGYVLLEAELRDEIIPVIQNVPNVLDFLREKDGAPIPMRPAEVNRILGKQDNIRFEVMPAAIFTSPEAACVGPSEDQLKEAGTPFECHKSFYRANGKALAMGETEGMVKLCTEPGEGRILSAHIFGAHAADLVQEVTAYITLGATLQQLRETVHIHPTLSEVLIGVN